MVKVSINTTSNVNAFMKLQVNNGYAGIDNNAAVPTIAENTTQEISISGTLAGVVTNEVVLLLDLRGTDAGKEITFSNFAIYDITE